MYEQIKYDPLYPHTVTEEQYNRLPENEKALYQKKNYGKGAATSEPAASAPVLDPVDDEPIFPVQDSAIEQDQAEQVEEAEQQLSDFGGGSGGGAGASGSWEGDPQSALEEEYKENPPFGGGEETRLGTSSEAIIESDDRSDNSNDSDTSDSGSSDSGSSGGDD